MSKQDLGFVIAGLLVVGGLCLAMWAQRQQPTPPATAGAPVSQDEAAKAASRAMTFTQAPERKK
jgi:hypothetical protein